MVEPRTLSKPMHTMSRRRSQPTADQLSQQNDPFQIKMRAYQKAETRRDEEIATLTATYPKIFNVMMGQMSRESEERVKQDPDWANADQDKSPLLLLAIIRKTHLQPQSGNAVVDQDAAERRYYNLQMGNATIAQFKKTFDDHVDALVAAGKKGTARSNWLLDSTLH